MTLQNNAMTMYYICNKEINIIIHNRGRGKGKKEHHKY